MATNLHIAKGKTRKMLYGNEDTNIPATTGTYVVRVGDRVAKVVKI